MPTCIWQAMPRRYSPATFYPVAVYYKIKLFLLQQFTGHQNGVLFLCYFLYLNFALLIII